MVTKDEALKMAIDFMETLTIDVGIKTWNEKHRKEAIKFCKDALEQEDIDYFKDYKTSTACGAFDNDYD